MSAFARRETRNVDRSPFGGSRRRQVATPPAVVDASRERLRGRGNQAVQRLLQTGVLQAKLAVGPVGDQYEQEADRVAEAVLRMPAGGAAPPATSPLPLPAIRRLCAGCEEELRRQPEEDEEEDDLVQTKALPAQTPEVTPQTQARIDTLRGGGAPLPGAVRAFFQPRFGLDLGNVRVHADGEAAALAGALGARAFTVGHDVVFGASQYATFAGEGRRLLAHELVHVAQQGHCRRLAASAPATAPIRSVVEPSRVGKRLQRRVQVLDDPLPPGVAGPPARTGAAFIEAALEAFTNLNLSYAGDHLAVDAATRAAVRRERRERPTAAAVRAREFIIPGVSRARASAALRLAQVVIDTRATAVIQPVFGEAPVLFGAFPAAGGGGTQQIDIADLRTWFALTEPSREPLLRIMAFLRGLLGRAAAPRPATPLRTDTPGSTLYHEVIESFDGALRGPGTLFPAPHHAAIDTANVALRAMGNLEFLPCNSPAAPAPGGELRIRVFWRRRRGAGREDRFEQALFLSAPPEQALVWVDPPVRIAASVPRTDPCPP